MHANKKLVKRPQNKVLPKKKNTIISKYLLKEGISFYVKFFLI